MERGQEGERLTTKVGRKESKRTLRKGTSDPRTVEAHFDEWADSYDATLTGWQYNAPEETAALLAPCLPREGARVFDVGCGTGLFGETLARHMKPAPVVLHGVDISSVSLKRAEKRGVYERLARHDLNVLPLPVTDDSQDAAAVVGVLSYFPDPEPLMRDLCRAVKPGGYIAFSMRSDLWEEREFDAMIARLEAAGRWRRRHVSQPQPYLPGNDEFADEIAVFYTLCRVM